MLKIIRIKINNFILSLVLYIRQNRLLMVIFIIGLVLRLWGTNPGYHIYHQEEPLIFSRALLTILGRQDEITYFGYPALVSLVHALIYLIFFLPLSFVLNVIRHSDLILSQGFDLPNFFKTYIVGVREVNILYWGRYTSAFLGSASILLTYVVGKRYFNKFVGLLAALFLALNYRHVLSSHFALIDVPNDLFFLIVFLPTLEILKHNRLKDYFIAGITAGLSFSVKLSPFALILPFIAHFLRDFKKRAWLDKQSLLRGVIIIVFFLVVIILVNIFHVFNPDTILHDSDALVPRYQVGKFAFRPYAYIYLLQYGLTPLISLLAVIGIIYGIKKYFKTAFILLTLILLFFFSLTIYSAGGLYVRNFVGIFPLLLIFSALGVEFIKKVFFLRFKKTGKLLLTILIIISISIPVINIITLDKFYSEDWNFTKAKEYLNNGFEGKIIAAQPIIASLVFPEGIKKLDYSVTTNFSLPELQEIGAEYVMIDSDSAASTLMWWLPSKGLNYFKPDPNNFAYSSFAGGALKELFRYQTAQFAKPWQAPEANLFLIKIPTIIQSNFEETVLMENFNQPVAWVVKGKQDGFVSEIGQYFGTHCLGKGCAYIGPIYFNQKKLFRVVRFTSPAIEITEGTTFQISTKIKSSQSLSSETRDGFMKVELYHDKQSAESEKSGEYIFTSSRNFGDTIWQEKKIEFLAPAGMKYATISFQITGGDNKTIYFDDLVIKKAPQTNREIINWIDKNVLPEDLIFVNSIL